MAVSIPVYRANLMVGKCPSNACGKMTVTRSGIAGLGPHKCDACGWTETV